MSFSKIKTFPALATSFTICFAAAATACFFESLSYVFVRPFSNTAHRHIALQFSYSFFLVSTFLLQVWSNVTFKIYGDALPKKKSCLIILNHSSSADFLIGLAHLAKMEYPSPGNTKSVVKASLASVPIFGTTLRFAEFLFLTRSWTVDRDNFLSSLFSLREYGSSVTPFWFVLFPEGTRLTADKIQHSKEYAVSQGAIPFSNVLYPRFKAFIATVSALRDRLDLVVDATYVFNNSPTLENVLAGKADTVIHAHAVCHEMKSLPEDDEHLQQWLLDRWREKDDRIAAFRRDPNSLGPSNESLFPTVMPSLAAFYVLVVAYASATVWIIYLCSNYQYGLLVLFSLTALTLMLVALFVVVTNRPSQKGGS